ncbi:MAG: 3-hydroxyacyl-CoA dehydrogenase NAD-binding domain-containing protein [Gaiellaceae bacterium]
MPPETRFFLRRAGDVAVVTIDNGEDHTKPSFFSRGALESLAAVLDKLESGDWEAMVLTGKPFVFAAGADITEFPGIDRATAIAGSRAGHEFFARIRALPFPTVAAVNGAALGGGVEIAVHCDVRAIASSVRHFALPECFLGIVPGWGGTQLVPRLVGPATAVKLIVENPLRQNRMLDAAKAVEWGLCDRVFEPVEFLDEALVWARELGANGVPERPEPDWTELETVLRRARTNVDDAVHGAAVAPYRALDLIEGAATWSIEEGYRAEEEAIGDLLVSRQAQASLYAFDLVERRAKKGVGLPEAKPRAVTKVGVVGAGLMATQLATLIAKRLGVPLVISDLDQARADTAVASIQKSLEGRWCPVTGTTSYAEFARCDLVIEAVFEEPDVKRQVFADLAAVVSPDCILATNTSSLSVAEMGADLGIHFFNPVAVMPLVELVRHAGTDDVKLVTAWEVVKRLGKRGVLTADTPGFVVNRVLTRMTRVLMNAIEHGTPVETTDEAMLGLGMPMAPSVLLQMVGPRVANHVLETMHAAYPDRFPLSPTLQNYANGHDEPVIVENAPRSAEQVRAEAMDAVADEIRLMLEEGVVAEAADVDTCLLLGAGWPFFMGGATKYLDQTGVSDRLFGRPFAELRAGAPA